MFFCFFCILLGFYFILFFNVHYTILFLSLELIILGLLSFLIFFHCFYMGLMGVFFFLLAAVCVGGFSISLLVCLSRGKGKDFWFSGSYIF